MKKIWFILLMVSISIKSIAQGSDAQLKFEKEISGYFNKKVFGLKEVKHNNANEKIYTLTVDQTFFGYAVLASAKGRMDYFDFMVIYNSQVEVEHIKVLIYRSQHGQEITNKGWLKQFYRKKGSLVYGKDIQAISGATFSAKSITEKINSITETIIEVENSRISD